MAMGIFTQCAALLLPELPEREVIEEAIGRRHTWSFIAGKHDGHWMGDHDTWAARREDRGERWSVDVSVAPVRWPDGMGHPQQEPHLFGAWSMGWLGPHTFPGNLNRAIAMAGLAGHRNVVEAAQQHRAFLILRSGYARGAGPKSVLIPAGYIAVDDLYAATALARDLMEVLPRSVYFNPGGETLHDLNGLRVAMDDSAAANLRPLPVWCNVRIWKPDGLGLEDDWRLMDTVGFQQFDVPTRTPRDHEALWPSERMKLDTGANWQFLLSIGAYAAENPDAIKPGDTTDGAGVRWRVMMCEEPLMLPPRRTMRWLPADVEVPAVLRPVAATDQPPRTEMVPRGGVKTSWLARLIGR